MNYSKQAARAALLALALLAASSASAVPVADSAALQAALDNWTIGQLDLELQPTTTPATFTARNSSGWPNGKLPGNLTVTSYGNLKSTDVTLKLLDPIKPADSSTLSITKLQFMGAVDASGTIGSTITLERVWLGGTGINQIRAGSLSNPATLLMNACCITNTDIDVKGSSAINRCTFMDAATVKLGGVLTTLQSNIFIKPPTLTGALAGSFNFIKDDALVISGITISKAGMITDEPSFLGTPWPGKLNAPFFVLDRANPVVAVTSVDFEGENIGTSFRPQVGADQFDFTVTPPDWKLCEIRGPVGTTAYKYPPDYPIVKGGTEVSIRIVTVGFNTPITPGSGGTPVDLAAFRSASLVVTPQNATAVASTIDLLPTDFTPVSGSTTNEYEIMVSYTTPSSVAGDPATFDGEALVTLFIDGQAVVKSTTVTDDNDRKFLIDSLPPLIPASADAIAVLGPVQRCGDWVRSTDNTSSGTPRQYVFNSPGTWTFSITVPLEDQIPGAGLTTAGFQAGVPLTSANTDVAAIPTDRLFNNTMLGTAVWTDDSFGDFSPPQATTRTMTLSGADTVFDVGGFPVTNLVNRIDAHFTIVDLAGNASVISLPLRLWNMPPDSTWAVVSGDNGDPTDPSFSWNMKLNGETGSAADFLDCFTRRPTASILVCHALDPEDIANSGWESVGGTGWTDLNEQSTVNSSTLINDGAGGFVRLGDLFNASLGQTLSVVVQLHDPAGNDQNMDTLITSLDTTLSLTALLNQKQIDAAGPYTIPSHLPEGTLDTFVSAKYFLNRTDRRDHTLLYNIDDDETVFGSGPNVPLTPLKACNQRLEAQYLVSVGIPDTLNVLDISVEFKVYEDGVLVARGNLRRKNDSTSGLPIGADRPMQLYLPSDLYTIQYRDVENPLTDVFVRPSGSSTYPDSGPDADHTADFLNPQPTACDAVNDIRFNDRLGDDGTVEKPGATNNGVLVKSPRTRAVNYTVEFMATTDHISSSRDTRDPQQFEYDPTPATIHFTVLPDASPDSEPPRTKVNEQR